jgi:hypothetical protein
MLTVTTTRQNRNREIPVQLELTPMSDDAFMGRGKPGADLTAVYFTRSGGREGAVKAIVLFLGGNYIDLAKK